MRTATEILDLELEVLEGPEDWLAALAQDIGYEAWARELQGIRPQGGVARVYKRPGDSSMESEELLLDEMLAAEAEGRFSAVVAYVGEQAVGYAWAAEVSSPSPLLRRVSARVGLSDPIRKPVQIKEINVLPEFQHQGLGSIILYELIGPYNQYQRPQADVPVEMENTVSWFQDRSFGESAESPEPDHRFGQAEKPVIVQRLVAPGVDLVQRQITHLLSGDSPFYRIAGEAAEIISQIGRPAN